MENLTPRQQMILNRVIDTHIETGDPVGSSSLTALFRDLYRDSYSSATVRHEMGLLEERGYLTHPHTSAGRLPTDQGYRFYVENGLRLESLAEEIQKKIGAVLREVAQEGEEALADKASQMLSELSEEVGFLVLPKRSRKTFGIRHQMVFSGLSRMIGKPEFQDREKVRALCRLLEDRMELMEWLLGRESGGKRISVSIGKENELEALSGCSVIWARYDHADREEGGVVALVSSRRVRYSRMIPLVDSMRCTLERILDQRGEGFES